MSIKIGILTQGIWVLSVTNVSLTLNKLLKMRHLFVLLNNPETLKLKIRISALLFRNIFELYAWRPNVSCMWKTIGHRETPSNPNRCKYLIEEVIISLSLTNISWQPLFFTYIYSPFCSQSLAKLTFLSVDSIKIEENLFRKAKTRCSIFRWLIKFCAWFCTRG